jgi:hypothetical protein
MPKHVFLRSQTMKMQSLLLCGALAFGAVLSQPAIAQTVFQVQTQDLTYDDYMSLGYNAYEEGRYGRMQRLGE